MRSNEELIKKIFSAFSSIKRHFFRSNNFIHMSDIKPSEQLLLLKIGNLMKDKKIIVTDIVNILELAPPTVSLTLNSLEDHGYIERTLNKDNRREIYVSLTDKGKKIFNNIKEKHYNFISKLINYLGEENTKDLVKLLEKTTSFLEEQEREEEEKGN